jgi:recombination protein RecT
MAKKHTTEALTVAEKPMQDMTPRELMTSRGLTDQVAKALPAIFTPERFMRVTLTAFNKNPKLWDCTKQSIASVVLQCAQFGVEPDGRHAHIIPYNGEATLQLDYKGLVALVRRSGDVVSIHADVVRKGDKFKVNLGEITCHEVDYSSEAGEVYAVYATARLKDGSSQSVVLRKEEVEAIRKRSRSGASGPWATDWAEMAKKTAFRRLTKWLPLSYEAAEVVEADQRREFDITATTTTEPQPATAQALTERLKAKPAKAEPITITETKTNEDAPEASEDY